MDDENIISLQAKIEELNKISSMKDEEIAKLKAKVNDLENKMFEISKSGYNEMDDFIISQFKVLSDERKNAEKENELLKEKLLRTIAKKHQSNNMLQALKLKCVPFSPKSPSGFEAENQKLTIQISNLESDINFTREQLDSANDEIQKYKQELDKLMDDKNKWVEDAAKHFNLLKAKLDEEREKMKSNNIGQIQLQNESLLAKIDEMNETLQNQQNEFQVKLESLEKEKENIEAENKSYQETINSLKDSNHNILTNQTDFLNSLNQIVGCQTLEEALMKVRGLALLPEKLQNLQEKVDSFKSGEVTQSHDVVIDALKEINEKLSPNNLNLPHDSILRQLFASLSNMFHAALNPKASKNTLDAHILSVVYQARSLLPQDAFGNECETNAEKHKTEPPSFFQMPQAKQPF